MERLEKHLIGDIQIIQSLEIVPSILELICRTSGMGFSAVARVTDSKWIACAVKDEINFGLKPGEELQLETTICNEIRGHGRPVVIDEVDKDDHFRNHHAPRMYGFQSYISIPIFLKDGSFFGTLCAIDPRPFSLKASNMVTMFNLYADLISYHLQTQDQIQASKNIIAITKEQLNDSLDDIRQYSHISRHTLQEPLRKLKIFTDLLTDERTLQDKLHVKTLATKINTLASDFSGMIYSLTEFSETTGSVNDFQVVDLNATISKVLNRLKLKILAKDAQVDYGLLHAIPGIPHQLNQLFYYIIDNALNFTYPEVAPVIKVSSEKIEEDEMVDFRHLAIHSTYCKISFQDNGIGIAKSHIDQIFDLFVRLNPKEKFPGLGMGLSQSKKIIRNHEGAIFVESEPGKGSIFSLLLPLVRNNQLSAQLAAN